MTFRWGKRSTGGIVKPGHGGWSLTLHFGMQPSVSYVNPETGDGVSVSGWNVIRSYRKAKRIAYTQCLKREAIRVGFILDRADELSTEMFERFAKVTGMELPRL